MKYVLDANVFIQAKNSYYAFAICPGFWDGLIHHHGAGGVESIDQVKQELLRGRDDLAAWVKTTVPDRFFAPTDAESVVGHYRSVMQWVQSSSQFSPNAKADFAAGADGWLIAYGKTHALSVVTHEQLSPEAKSRVPIPNVCEAFHVRYVDTFRMLKELNVSFTWQPE